MNKNEKILNEICEKLFSLMSVDAKVSISFDDKEETFIINVDANDMTGLLIGKRGETLLSIQNIISVLYKKETGEWAKIVVNVGDYREKEEEYLRNLAQTTAQRALDLNAPQNLYNLQSWQRRVIHMFLSEDSRVETVSEGEGEDRHLIVSPKK